MRSAAIESAWLARAASHDAAALPPIDASKAWDVVFAFAPWRARIAALEARPRGDARLATIRRLLSGHASTKEYAAFVAQDVLVGLRTIEANRALFDELDGKIASWATCVISPRSFTRSRPARRICQDHEPISSPV